MEFKLRGSKMLVKGKRILVLIDKYFPRPYANAMCAQELIDVWTKEGHIVDILAYEDFDGVPAQWKGSNVYYVRPDARLRLFYYADTYQNTNKGKIACIAANILSKVKGLLLLPWQPFYSFSFPRRIYQKICDLYEQNNYDGIVSVLNPLDSNIAACRFKSHHPQVPYIVFCVDTLRKGFVERHLGEDVANGFMWEKKILQNCDAYFYMRARREDYAPIRYEPYRSKLKESDMPRFKIKRLEEIPQYDFGEGGEHWVYAGSIGGVHYDPYAMLDIFKQISKEPKRVLHLYTRGGEAEKIAKIAANERLNVRVHGYVDAETLKSVMATADVIVSLKTSNQISAKIFECMSYGKTVVHFSGDKNDPNVYYLNKYTLGHTVRMYNNINVELKALLSFLKDAVGRQADMQKLNETFAKSTPEYSADRILEELEAANAYGQRGNM